MPRTLTLNTNPFFVSLLGALLFHIGWHGPTLNAQSGFSSAQSFLEDPNARMLENPEAVFTTDVDGDGDEDLIAIGRFEALLYRNDGSGQFSAGKKIGGLDDDPILCATMLDGNGDGIQDLAIGYEVPSDGHYIGFCKGNGFGFDPMLVLNPLPFYHPPQAMANGNILGAPGEELVVAVDHYWTFTTARMLVYEFDASGTTGAQHALDFSTTGGYHTVEVVDLNNDGQNEIIATAADEEAIKMFQYAGGSFSAPLVLLTSTDVGSTRPTELTRTMDWNEDGLLDLFWSDDNGLSINVNNGSGFDPPLVLTPSPTANTRFNNILPYDVDGDGDEDLILQRSSGQFLSWLERTPSGIGAFTPIDHAIVNYYLGPGKPLDQTLRLADLDGDGLKDLVALGEYEHILAYYPGQAGGFGVRQLADPLSNSMFQIPTDWIELGDFDDDGDRDLLLMTKKETHATVAYENNGMGWSRHILGVNNTYYRNLTLADLDNDGLKDIAYYEALDIGMFRNNGDWSVDTVVLLDDTQGGSEIISGDLNADGKDDLVLQNLIDGVFRTIKLINDGASGLIPKLDFGLTASGVLLGMKAEDLNGDGAAELLASSSSASSPYIKLLRNKGNGNYFPEEEFVGSSGTYLFPTPIQIEPGRSSFICRQGDFEILLFRQNPGGGFSAPILVHTSPSEIESLAAADLNGDGFEDILYGTADGKVRWIASDGFGGIDFVRTIDVLPYPVEFVDAEDVNGDGKLDAIAVAQDFDRREMRWYANMLPAIRMEDHTETSCVLSGPSKIAVRYQFYGPSVTASASAKPMEQSYRIVDVQGRTIQQGRIAGPSISLPEPLSSGSYWLVSESGHQCRFYIP